MQRIASATGRAIRPRIRRQRLVVVAPRVVEVVRCTGGWLFDRVMAGWEVTVLIVDHTDTRPLRILGAGVGDLESALAMPPLGPAPQALAVEAGLYESDTRVRRMVRDALDRSVAEVWLWGEGLSAANGPVRHRLSVAARAFKAQALVAAVGPADSVPVTELFFHTSSLIPA
ncbi:MAG TPA: hypothetical protein VJT31_13045 [Rugosimonospora sp.]|nr:hypothetical protein [Rugosimonospora sp.]